MKRLRIALLGLVLLISVTDAGAAISDSLYDQEFLDIESLKATIFQDLELYEEVKNRTGKYPPGHKKYLEQTIGGLQLLLDASVKKTADDFRKHLVPCLSALKLGPEFCKENWESKATRELPELYKCYQDLSSSPDWKSQWNQFSDILAELVNHNHDSEINAYFITYLSLNEALKVHFPDLDDLCPSVVNLRVKTYIYEKMTDTNFERHFSGSSYKRSKSEIKKALKFLILTYLHKPEATKQINSFLALKNVKGFHQYITSLLKTCHRRPLNRDQSSCFMSCLHSCNILIEAEELRICSSDLRQRILKGGDARIEAQPLNRHERARDHCLRKLQEKLSKKSLYSTFVHSVLEEIRAGLLKEEATASSIAHDSSAVQSLLELEDRKEDPRSSVQHSVKKKKKRKKKKRNKKSRGGANQPKRGKQSKAKEKKVSLTKVISAEIWTQAPLENTHRLHERVRRWFRVSCHEDLLLFGSSNPQYAGRNLGFLKGMLHRHCFPGLPHLIQRSDFIAKYTVKCSSLCQSLYKNSGGN